MKTKFTFLFLIQIAFILFSCSSDDSSNNMGSSISIIGNWDLESANFPSPLDFNGDGVTSTDLIKEVPCFNIASVFNENGTYSNDAVDLDIVIGIAGVDISCLTTTTTDSGTWTLDGDRLTIVNVQNEETNLTITLEENKLSFSDEFQDIGEVEYVFVRQ